MEQFRPKFVGWAYILSVGPNFPTNQKIPKKLKLLFSDAVSKNLFSLKTEQFRLKFCRLGPDFVGWAKISQLTKK